MRRLHALFLTAAFLPTFVACNRQQKTDEGKTYTSNQKSAPAASGSQDSGPLDSPADTVNGKKSQASDNGSSSATNGQVVAQPGGHREPAPPPRR